MAEIICPTNGVRGKQEAKGVKPKNHMAAYRQQLKKQEQTVKERTDAMSTVKCKWSRTRV